MERRVEARVLGDRVDPVMRFTFGLGRNTRRKSFPAAVGRKRWRSEVGEAAGHGREERESIGIRAITRVKTIEKTTSLQIKIENLKTQLKGKLPCVTSNVATPKVFVFKKHAIDVDPLPQPLRNNRSVHNGYLYHLKDTLDTLHETVEEARSNRPSDNSLEYACVYTKHS
ncbi:hypothetical protein Tco_0256629 [Tanacetum coccineum]